MPIRQLTMSWRELKSKDKAKWHFWKKNQWICLWQHYSANQSTQCFTSFDPPTFSNWAKGKMPTKLFHNWVEAFYCKYLYCFLLKWFLKWSISSRKHLFVKTRKSAASSLVHTGPNKVWVLQPEYGRLPLPEKNISVAFALPTNNSQAAPNGLWGV